MFLAAALMVVSGLDHLHLWDNAYRHVPTFEPLFLVQTVAAFVGFILAATVGLFGLILPVVTGWADLTLGSEALSALLLAVVVFRHVRPAGVVTPA